MAGCRLYRIYRAHGVILASRTPTPTIDVIGVGGWGATVGGLGCPVSCYVEVGVVDEPGPVVGVDGVGTDVFDGSVVVVPSAVTAVSGSS
jgi:hypothetical protein